LFLSGRQTSRHARAGCVADMDNNQTPDVGVYHTVRYRSESRQMYVARAGFVRNHSLTRGNDSIYDISTQVVMDGEADIGSR
jgi:hypothetical protein